MENTKEKEISLQSLWEVLKKSLLVMLIAAVVLGSVAAVLVATLSKPQHVATIKFFVNTMPSSNNITSSYTYGSSALADNCVELVSEDLPARRAVREYDLTTKLGYSKEEENKCVLAVRKMLSAGKTKNSDTSFSFYIKISGDDPTKVFEVAKAFEVVMPDVMKSLIHSNSNTGTSVSEARDILTLTTGVNELKDIVIEKPSPVKAALITAFITMLAVYVIYLIVSLFDTVVYDESALKNNFDLPIVGTIPNWVNSNSQKKKTKLKRDHKHGIDMSERDYSERILSADTPFAVTEAFNQLRTNIVYSAGNTTGTVIAVTSAISGSGKSLMSVNLALSLTGLCKKILLVECDMRCPSFGRIFGNKNKQGLSELLAGLAEDYSSVVVNEADGKLGIIYSGKIPPNPSELLASAKMAELVNQWRENYDIIIFDMPPICEVADAGVVSHLVSGYLLTVRCDYSDVNEVKRAANSISAVNGKIYGFVLNDFNPKKVGKYVRSYYNSEEKYKKAKDSN